MSFVLAPGGGIEKKMQTLGDDPASDEQFQRDYSQAYGKSGRRYVWIRLTNTVHVYDPS
jgi:hypothetical protein